MPKFKKLQCLFLLLFWQYLSTSEKVLAQPSSNFIQVDKIDIVGNTVFSDRQLKKIIPELSKELVSLSQLYKIREAITDHYIKRGYISSGAFVPQQKFVNGTVKIQVIEALLSEVEVKGLSKIKQIYITSRLPVGKPLNQKEVYRSLAKLDEDPLIKKVRAELVRISHKQNTLILTVKERYPLQTKLNFSSNYNPSIGSFGASGNAAYHLLGYGDILSFNYTHTNKNGLIRYGASYTLPINPQNGQISLSYTKADSQVVEEPIVSALDIQSDFSAYKFLVRQPIDLGNNKQLGLEFSLEDLQTQTLINDTSFAFTEGLPDGKVNLTALRFAQEYNELDENSSVVVRSQFNLGIDVFGDSTITEAGIDSIFWSWQGQTQWLQKINGDVALVSTGQVQLSGDKLLPIEQLSLGGQDSVRGYRRNLSSGDNGAMGSLELQIPILSFSEDKGKLMVSPFVEGGTVWNNSSQEIFTNTLVSTGVGLDLDISEWLGARFDYAVPLVNSDIPDEFSKQAVTFDLSVKF